MDPSNKQKKEYFIDYDEEYYSHVGHKSKISQLYQKLTFPSKD